MTESNHRLHSSSLTHLLRRQKIPALMLLCIFSLFATFVTVALAANPSANLDQCANGAAPSPNTDGCNASASDWLNGNLGANKANYFEGDSVPYRITMSGLTTGAGNPHSVTITWDTTKSSKHALDYLTTFNRTVANADPCLGVSGCSTFTTFPIPKDPQVDNGSGSPITQAAGVFRLYGGTITSVSAYSYPGGAGFTGDKSASITINFTASVATPVLAWGGHIASRSDWGMGNSAVAITGSPYHTSLGNLDGSGGNQDRSLSADAVVFPGSITIIKDAVPNDAQDFSYTATGGLSPSSFSLDDDSDPTLSNTRQYSMITTFTGYSFTEAAVSGWTLSFGSPPCTVTSANGGTQLTSGSTLTVNLTEGENVTCTFTNTRQPGHLIVIKHVINDNGGTATAANFTMTVTGNSPSPASFPGSESPGTSVALSPGSYSVSESSLAGYSQTSASAECAGTIAAGQTKTCTITNDDQAAHLIVIKHVINDNGGTASASDFTLDAGGANDTPDDFAGAEAPGTNVTLNAGSYAVTESGPSGYTRSDSADCAGSIALGETKTCTVTNDDQAAHLIVIKHVINDNGGTATAANFTLDAGGANDTPDDFAGAEAPGTNVTLDAGSYAVTESGPSGYTRSDSADCAGSIANGETKTCTVTNDDQAAHLIVIKHVINDNGGSAVASDFTLNSGGTNAAPATFAGDESGTNVTLDAGAYSVSESGPSGYTRSDSTDCAGTIAVGETKTCTVTNDDQTAHLIVIKHVVNDNGGTAVAGDFTLDAGGANDTPDDFAGAEAPGTNVTLDAGSYAVTESGPSGYTRSDSADCAGTIANGETKTCTVTNDDQAAHLIVIKHVVNDNGGSAVASDFTLDAGGTNDTPDDFAGAETPGTDVTLDAGSYAVTESGPSGYTRSDSADCAGTIAVGETKTCTVTNDDQAAHLIVIKHVVNDNGGSAVASDFTLDAGGANDTPDDFAGAEAPGTDVTLDAGSYAVTESGPSGYTRSDSTDCAGTIALGETKTCTVTNDDQAAHLIVIKHVINDNGGSAVASDFTLDSGGTNDTPDDFAGAEAPGTDVTLDAGSYAVTESGPSGYTRSDSADCAGTIANGETKTCTVTNDDQAATLTVIKHVINDNGGSATANQFTMTVAGTAVGGGSTSFAGTEAPGTDVVLSPGSYSVSESSLAGYTQTSASADCTGSIALGEHKTCTVTNDDQAATLIVIKHVINDNGGTAVAGDFTMTVTGQSPSPASFAGAEAPGTTITINAGLYNVSESGPSGYTENNSTDCFGTIANGETKTCTVTNDDQAAHLIVIKHVVNDNGGSAVASDFTLDAGGANDTPDDFAGDEGGTNVTLDAGSYAVTESGPAGYTRSDSADCAGTIAVGETKTCTVTNDDNAATLIVIKHVVNDNGGSAVASDFTLDAGGTNDTPDNFAGDEGGTSVTLDAGSYAVTESGPSGYTRSDSADCTGSIALGETKTCTVTNDDQAAHLIVIKHVINDNGGSAVASDFTLDAGGANDTPDNFAGAEAPGTDVTLDAGSYAVTESGPSGYTRSDSADCAGTIALGETKTCTVTNDDQTTTLTVIKHVVNDNGGSATADQFTMTAAGTAVAGGSTSFAGAESPGTDLSVTPGSYSVSESGPSGYTESDSADCTGSIALGEHKTCTITNDDQTTTLTVIKHVVNDNGGSATADQFTMMAAGTAVAGGSTSFAGAESPGTDLSVTPGSYSVSESGPSGYTESDSTDCTGSITLGEHKTCTITNDDQAAHLIVIKHVINNSGGSAVASDFTMTVTGSSPSPASFPGDESGTNVTLDAGSYSVAESGPDGYTESDSADCAGSIANGETKTCTITNNDNPATLIVIKHVINDNGGTASASDFTMTVTGSSPSPASFPGDEGGTSVSLNVGSYSVSESGPAGYSASYSADCSGSLANGQTKTCTVTNNDQAATLIVIKHVINDNGGSAVASDFTLDAGGANDTPDNFAGDEGGTSVTLDPGSYAVTESGPAGYTRSDSADCAGTIAAGETKTCTVTNDDQAAHLIVIKHVINDNGGTAVASDFTLDAGGANDTPDNFAGAEAPGTSVTLDAGSYAVTETGPAGYGRSDSADCAGTIALGETKTCTVTNNDQAATLIVIKHVINDNGGTASASDFTMTVTGNSPSPASFAGAESPGTSVALSPGSYSVGESSLAGYAQTSASADCAGSIAAGQTKTCTITNDDQAATLIVIKHVINDNGGTASAANFTMTVTGNSPSPASFAGAGSPGTSVALSPGSYSVGESSLAGYAQTSASADCAGTIAAGQTKTCTITNDDQAAHLIVIKHVINDNGGTASAANFTMSVTGGSPSPASFPGAESPGTNVTLNAGSYSVGESGPSGYSASYSADCTSSIANGQTKTCTVTNDDTQQQVVSQITPTSTTCAQFSNGSATTLSSLQYSLKSGKISEVNPGVFFYWVKVTVTSAGSKTFTINQNIVSTNNNFTKKFAFASGSNAFTSSCVAVKGTKITQNATTSAVTVTFNASAAGTYVIGIKYNSTSVKGVTAPSPNTQVDYQFSTSGVAGSTQGISLKKK
jgi:hypothetical protein